MRARRITRPRVALTLVVALCVIVAWGMRADDSRLEAGQSASQVVPSLEPRPIRNDVAKPGRELLVLRHHQLRKGGHDEFYRLK